MLVSSFRIYRSRRPFSQLKLVLAGQPGHSQVQSSNGVVNLGRVEDVEKELLLDRCRALAQPSVNESYSRVMIEAWMHGRPVAVHSDCLATAVPTAESGGGWVARGVDAWSRVLEAIDEGDDVTLDALGARGRRYAEEYGRWDKVISRYEAALGLTDDMEIVVGPREWDILPDRSLISALQDGRINIVFAGPFVEFGPLAELIEAFLHYLTLERHARLVLVGLDHIEPEVYEKLTREVETLRLNDVVVVTTSLPLAQQLAVFRTSCLFWSMDGESDLGRYLLTAMWFDIPIFAFKSPQIAAIIGQCSLLFTSKSDLLEIAAFAKILTTDEKLRASIISKQRQERARMSLAGPGHTRV
jgi:glycosyltransferase involved in cell wall biosynthesis